MNKCAPPTAVSRAGQCCFMERNCCLQGYRRFVADKTAMNSAENWLSQPLAFPFLHNMLKFARLENYKNNVIQFIAEWVRQAPGE